MFGAGIWSRMAALCAVTALLAGCDSKEDTYIETPDPDPRLDAAISEARASLPTFWSKFDRRKAGEGDYLVKAGMKTTGGGTEHIWMDVLDHSADKITGRLANEPEHLSGLSIGSQVEVDVRDVSDWAYSRDGKFYGHFTTRVLSERMPPDVRAQADRMLAPTPLEPEAH